MIHEEALALDRHVFNQGAEDTMRKRYVAVFMAVISLLIFLPLGNAKQVYHDKRKYAVRGINVPYLLGYDRSKWVLKRSIKSFRNGYRKEYTIRHRSGEASGVVFTSRSNAKLKNMTKILVSRLRRVLGNEKVIKNMALKLHGINVSYVRMVGDSRLTGSRVIMDAVFWAGRQGQVLVFAGAADNLYKAYTKDILWLLNGLFIGRQK